MWEIFSEWFQGAKEQYTRTAPVVEVKGGKASEALPGALGSLQAAPRPSRRTREMSTGQPPGEVEVLLPLLSCARTSVAAGEVAASARRNRRGVLVLTAEEGKGPPRKGEPLLIGWGRRERRATAMLLLV